MSLTLSERAVCVSHSVCAQNASVAQKIMVTFLVKIEPKMRDVREKMWECWKEGKVKDFPHDFGMVDMCWSRTLLSRIIKHIKVELFGILVYITAT